MVQKVLEYRKIEKNVQQTQQSINEMIRIREQLMKTSEEENIFEDGKCPYCGYVWQEKEQLLNNIEKTTNDVNSLLGTTGKQMKEIVDTISETFLQNVWGDAEVLISDLESNVLLSAFMEFDESDIVQKYKYIEKFLKDTSLVKKTLSIPKWANDKGTRLGINFSKVLTVAIENEAIK